MCCVFGHARTTISQAANTVMNVTVLRSYWEGGGGYWNGIGEDIGTISIEILDVIDGYNEGCIGKFGECIGMGDMWACWLIIKMEDATSTLKMRLEWHHHFLKRSEDAASTF